MAPPSLSWFTTSLADSAGIAQLRFDVVENLAGSADEITIVAAYWDTVFLSRLLAAIPIPRRNRVTVRIFVNGFSGKRGAEQTSDLRQLVGLWRKRKLPHLTIGLVAGSRLFHSKVFVFEQAATVNILVGSANATEAAFANNEELMVMIQATDTPRGLRQYLKAVAETATPLSQIPPYVAHNLPAFFRGGDVYYRPTVATSFRFELRLPSELREAMAQLQEPIAGIVARAGQTYDPFAGVLTEAEQREHDAVSNSKEVEELPRGRVPLRSYGIQTCYGWWVPSAYQHKIEPSLASAGTRRRTLLDRLEELLTEEETKIRRLATSRFDQLASFAKREGFDLQESPTQRFERFEAFLGRTKGRLDDLRWRQRAEQPYMQAAVPEIWNDPASSAEFIDSFFDYLEFITTMKNKPAIWKSLTLRIPSLEHSQSSDQIMNKLDSHLRSHGWLPEDWGPPAPT